MFYFLSCPEPPLYISGVCSFPVKSGGYLKNLTVPFSVRKLALTRETFLHVVTCRHRFLAYGVVYGGIGCLSVCPWCVYTSLSTFGCLYISLCICQYFHTSASTFIHPYIYSYVSQCIFTYVNTLFSTTLIYFYTNYIYINNPPPWEYHLPLFSKVFLSFLIDVNMMGVFFVVCF